MKESNRLFNAIAVCCAAMIAVSQSAAAEEKPARMENQPRPRPAITNVTMNVKGVGCPFCVYGLEKKLKQVEGIQDVEFNLKTGVAPLEVSQKPIPQVDQLREAVKKAGFTLGQIHLTATGSLAQESETYVLNLRESDQSFLLFEKTNREQVKGYLTEPTRKKLSRLKEEGALASVTGPLHFHAEGAPGLAVEKVVPADSVSLAVKGMFCGKCAQRVTTVIKRVEPVAEVRVDMEKDRVTIWTGEGPVNSQAIVQAIEDAGFEATVKP